MAVTATSLSSQVGTVLRVDGGPAGIDLFSVHLTTGLVTSSYLASMVDFLEEKVLALWTAIPLADRATFADGILRSLLRVGTFDLQTLTFTVTVAGGSATLNVTGYADPSYLIVSTPHSTNFAAELDAGFSTPSGGAGSAGVVTTGPLTVRVSSVGADGPNVNRPQPLTSGTYTTDEAAFATINGAVEDIPRIIDDAVVIEGDPATSMDGAQALSGFTGDGVLYFQGEFTNVTPTTGVVVGVAGTGTSPTTLVKPDGEADWTANEFEDAYLIITAGGGSVAAPGLTVRPIRSNTVNNVVVDSIPGMDGSSEFRIATAETVVRSGDQTTCLTVSDNQCRVEIRGLKFVATNPGVDVLDALLVAARNKSLLIEGCTFDVDSSFVLGDAVQIGSQHEGVTIRNCIVRAGDQITVTDANSVTIQNVNLESSGPIAVSNSRNMVATGVFSRTAPSTVLSAINLDTLSLEISASDGGATPVYLENVKAMETAGTKAVGSGNTGYGLEIQKAGRYTLTGSTITGGTGDVWFVGRAVTWANLSSPNYGIVEEHAASAIANASYTKAIKYGSYLYDGNIDVSGRLLLYGYLNQAWPLAAQTALGNNAGTALNMDSVPALGGIDIDTAAAGTGVRLPSNAAVAGVVVGVVNRGANAITVYAPAGGTVDGGASVTVAVGKAKIFVSLTGGLAWWTLSATV